MTNIGTRKIAQYLSKNDLPFTVKEYKKIAPKSAAAIELGRKGGRATYKKRGKKYMSLIGKKGRAKQIAAKQLPTQHIEK